jgi:hypothetical protein
MGLVSLRWLGSSIGLAMVAFGVSACSFDKPEDQELPEEACYFAYAKLCALSFNGPRKFTGASTLNTSTDSTCTKVIPADTATGAPELCVISAKSIDVLADATIRVTGKRPIVFAAEDFLRVAGAIDASSTRARTAAEGGASPEVLGAGADSVACTTFARDVVDNPGGGSGGAGGSFAGRGGAGGDGNTGILPTNGGLTNAAINVDTLAVLRGGCRGQAGGTSAGNVNGGPPGAGGPPGGVLYLASRDMLQILETGKLGANGGGGAGGGAQAGGGGGGSGGLIVLEALGSIRHTGLLSANGGGGGGGGQYDTSGTPVARSGAGGSDGSIARYVATGGAGQPGGTTGGDGAVGGANGYNDASAGSASQYGGGGGGGGVGWIHAIAPGAITGAGNSSPPLE